MKPLGAEFRPIIFYLIWLKQNAPQASKTSLISPKACSRS